MLYFNTCRIYYIVKDTFRSQVTKRITYIKRKAIDFKNEIDYI